MLVDERGDLALKMARTIRTLLHEDEADFLPCAQAAKMRMFGQGTQSNDRRALFTAQIASWAGKEVEYHNPIVGARHDR